MLKRTLKFEDVLFYIVGIATVLIVAFRSALVPFNHDETATFFHFIQSRSFIPYHSLTDANNHVLNSFLSWIAFKCFGDSTFVLRLPNLAGFIILLFGIKRFFKYSNNTGSKLILIAGFLLSFHWLSFFSACRGYGLSMGLFIFGLSLITDYIYRNKFLFLVIAYLALDLAISANLVLLVPVLMVTGLIAILQIRRIQFFNIRSFGLLITHLAIIFFWVKYSLFLKQEGALYYGMGDSYWAITFRTLIHVISGQQKNWIEIAFFLSFVLVNFGLITIFIKRRKEILDNPEIQNSLFYFVLFNGLILGFYLMKVLMGVNFPEDRTGLFFYVLFVFNFSIWIGFLSKRKASGLGIILILVALFHFCVNLNFRKHSLYVYEVFPKRFYDRLVEEQKKSDRRITIGGNANRELFYAFMNYHNNGFLNLMDSPYYMHMTTDYYVAFNVEKKYYEPFYEELDRDPDWGFILLKRKEKIEREFLFELPAREIKIEPENEYINLIEKKDTSFNSDHPLLVEFNVSFIKGNLPPKSWFVLSIDDEKGENVTYKRVPLNWLRKDWFHPSNQNYTFDITSNKLPAKIGRLVFYIWNTGKQSLNIRINNIKLFRLNAKGITAEGPVRKKPIGA